MTGSSWTTIATIGVALMGIGQPWVSRGWIAGAIISAPTGDKISLLSDTTVLASSTVGVPISRTYVTCCTTVPSFNHRCGGFRHRGADARSQAARMPDVCAPVVARTFRITPMDAGGARGDGRADRAQTPGHRDALLRRGFRLHSHCWRNELVAKVAESEGWISCRGSRRADELLRLTAIPTGSPHWTSWLRRAWRACSIPAWLICAMLRRRDDQQDAGALTSVFLRFSHAVPSRP